MNKRLLVAIASALVAACGGKQEGFNAIDLLEGEAIYRAECASCHGANREGQPEWRKRLPDGKLPAPPLDPSGNAWQRSYEQLFAMTKFGMVPPNAPDGYVSGMPSYGGKLSDEQIRRVLVYIESTWPVEVRAQRAERLKTQK